MIWPALSGPLKTSSWSLICRHGTWQASTSPLWVCASRKQCWWSWYFCWLMQSVRHSASVGDCIKNKVLLTRLFPAQTGSSLGPAMYASWRWEWNPVATSFLAFVPCWPWDSFTTHQGGSAYEAGATSHVSGHNIMYSVTFLNLS